jgi:hypothetical protein
MSGLHHSDANDDDLWRGEVTAELRHINQSVRDLGRQLHELRVYMADEVACHADYHARNEHRWGFAKWCQMHPLRFAFVAVAVALLLAGHRADHLREVLRVLGGWL